MNSNARSLCSLVAAVALMLSGTAYAQGPGNTKGKASKPSAAPALSATPPPEPPTTFELKVKEIVGSKADGWVPKALAGLKRNMSPADVAAKGVSGAGDINEFGFADASLDAAKPGLQSLQLYYRKDKAGEWRLMSATLRFDNTFEFSDILAACTKKYGKAKPAEVEKHLVTWVSPRLSTVQLSKSFTDGASFELSVFL